MREFEWSEVVDYLNNNLDKEFDYGNTWSKKLTEERHNKKCNCLMAAFFDSKGIDFESVSFCGFEAYEGGAVAKIKNPPMSIIGVVHMGEDEKSLSSGRDIKKRLDELTNQG